MKPVDVQEGGGEWSWVMSVFRLTTPKSCSKYIHAKVLRRLGTLSGSVAPADWLRHLEGRGGLGSDWVRRPLEAARGSSDGRDEGVREVDEQRKAEQNH
jgi:hypothetical protein